MNPLDEATQNLKEIDELLDSPYFKDERELEERLDEAADEVDIKIVKFREDNNLTNEELLKRLHKDSIYSTLTVEELYKKEYPAENYIIDKFLPQTGFTMFSGDSGVGKSWVALEIVRAITNNDIFLDHFEIKIPNIPILIIDKENGLRRIQARMRSLGIPPTENVHLLAFPEKFTLNDQVFMEFIKDFINENKIGIVIVDSFIDILIGDESSSTETAKVFNLLRSISQEICWVVLHHESRPTPKVIRTGGERYRGSTNIKAQLDYLFSIQATKQLKTIHIEQGKARDYQMLSKFAIEFINIEGTDEMSGFKYIGEVKEDIKLADEAAEWIFEYLTDHSLTMREELITVAQNNGITERSIRSAITILKKKGLIDSVTQPGQGHKRFLFILQENTLPS